MQVQILPSRQALVDRIELQYEYGQSIVSLLGGPGLGKSYILESFLTDKYADFNKVYLQLTNKTTEQVIISQLLEQTFSQPLIDFNLSLSENYKNLNDQHNSKNTVIVIDNAQFLSHELASEIEYLTVISDATFYVLTGSTSKVHFKNATDIHFEPLSFDESLELMSMYFKKLPNQHEPIFKAFIESAAGNPALLLSWESSSSVEEAEKSKHGFLLLCLVFVVLITLALSYIFEHFSQNKQIADLRAENKQNIDQVSKAEHYNDTSEQIQKPVSKDTQQLDIGKLQLEGTNSELVAPREVKPNNETVDPIKSETMTINENLTQEAIEPSPTKNITLNNIETSSYELQNKVPLEQAEEIKGLENEASTQSLDNTYAQENPKEIQQTVLAAPVMQDGYDNTWFIQQQDSLVMLQLIGVSQENLIGTFISNHKLNNIKVYKSTRYGSDWWVVTAGPFKDINQSQVYKSTLTEQLKQLQPFSKKIKVIKTEIALLKSI